MKLFKYVDEHITDVLKNHRIKVTRISDLNDPFDCFPSCFLDASEEELLRRFLSEEGLQEMIQRNPEAVAQRGGADEFKLFMRNQKQHVLTTARDKTLRLEVFSSSIKKYRQGAFMLALSEVADDILMWSHYAAQHKGAVIEFETETGQNGLGLWGFLLKKVDYENERPVVNPCGLDSEVKQQFDKVFLTKSLHWSYEKEWRQLFSEELLERDGDFCFLKINPLSIRGVILGCAVSETFKSQVMALMQQPQLRHAAFKQATLHEKEYKVEIMDVI